MERWLWTTVAAIGIASAIGSIYLMAYSIQIEGAWWHGPTVIVGLFGGITVGVFGVGGALDAWDRWASLNDYWS